MTKRIAVLVLAGVLAGCAVGPDYEPPALQVPADFGADLGPAGDLTQWWTAFGDPMLNSLVERALAANHDLRIARERVREARALAVAAGAAMWPAVSAGGSYTRFRTSDNAIQGDFPIENEQGLYRAGFDAAWEIDVFGGIRRGREAATADLQAAQEDERAARVTLLGELGRAYVDYRGAQRELAVLEQSVRSARETVELTRTRLRGGLGTDLDVARAEALMTTTESLLPVAETARRRALHRASVLLGVEPRALARELEEVKPIPGAPDRIQGGLPSDLLLRRPDVRAAERRLHAAVARVGVATADLYPKFSIVGSFGLESVDADDFVSSASRFWSIGPSVFLPIFEGGRLKAQLEAADARSAQDLAVYEQSFLLALEEVENAIVAWAQEIRRRRSLTASVASNRRAANLSQELHRRGLVNFLDVLQAEQALYVSQVAEARSEASASAAAVALYKALGGGW